MLTVPDTGNRELLLPPEPPREPERPSVLSAPPVPSVPSPKAQSWGAVISIIIIMLMIVIGAFYAWGQRIAKQSAFTDQPNLQSY